jgi:nitrite reductase/ring-hydroxylating ferredoxin subunit
MSWARVAGLAELERKGVVTATVGGRPVAVFFERGQIYAVDNRCPHMGFPLSKGTLKDGILTCHWHSWQFDASCGGCFTSGGSHVDAFAWEVRDGDVWIREASPTPAEVVGRWTDELGRGLERLSVLRIAKACRTLLERDVPARDLVGQGVRYGSRYRDSVGSGLVTLGVMANLVRDVDLDPDDQVLALVHGLWSVAADIESSPARRFKGPLPGSHADAARLTSWFRRFVLDREEEAAERVLATAISTGWPADRVFGMIAAAATDFVFLDEGHALDFANKSFELLDHVGWEAARDLLPGLIGPLCRAKRHEEDMTWKHPHDLLSLAREIEPEMMAAADAPGGWSGHEALAERLLAEDPGDVARGLVEAARAGAAGPDLTLSLCAAASLRLARFHRRNEFSDWDTVHHAVTHANALHRAVLRSPGPLLRRSIAHAALHLFLARFLNIPRYRLPHERASEAASADPSLESIQRQIETRKVDEVADSVYAYICSRHAKGDLVRALVHASIVEDHGFHVFQQTEAAVAIARDLGGSPLAYVPLAGLARYLAAHSPTPRSVKQTVDNAIKLQRGGALHE